MGDIHNQALMLQRYRLMVKQEMDQMIFNEDDVEGKPCVANFSEKMLQIYKNKHPLFQIVLNS